MSRRFITASLVAAAFVAGGIVQPFSHIPTFSSGGMPDVPTDRQDRMWAIPGLLD